MPANRISLFSQPFSILYFWATSHFKEKRKPNKMVYFSCLGNETTGINNFKNLLGNTEVWAFLEKLQCEDFGENECHFRNQHQKLNRMTYISLLNNFPSQVHPWSPPAVYLIHFVCSPLRWTSGRKLLCNEIDVTQFSFWCWFRIWHSFP
jgi:hypothetical protein